MSLFEMVNFEEYCRKLIKFKRGWIDDLVVKS